MNNSILVPTEEMFENWLDDNHPEIEIADRRFFPSVILKKLDPERYQEAFEEYCDRYVSDQLDGEEPVTMMQSVGTVPHEPVEEKLYYPIAFLNTGDMSQAIATYERNCDSALYPISL